MISAEQITQAFDSATRQFRQSDEYQELVAGVPAPKPPASFCATFFRTHFLSSHVVALCFASLPSTAAELLRENLLEEMGRSDAGKPHWALLLELARGVGFDQSEIDGLIADARRRLAVFCATRVPASTLRGALPGGAARNHELRVHAVALFERDRRRLTSHYGFAKPALHWFALHSELTCATPKRVTIIQDYLSFH